MAKNIALKDAIKQWEEKTKENAAEAKVVKLLSCQPFLAKLDNSLAMLANVEQLSLSTNQIEKISNLQGMPKLRILSLGRNNIKKIEGLEAVSETLEELWISYNQIERLNGIECCKKLRVLYAANNKVKAWDGVLPLQALPALEELILQGSPLEEKCSSESSWIPEITRKLPSLKKLDGKPIFRDEEVGEDANATNAAAAPTAATPA